MPGFEDKKETDHLIDVLTRTKQALAQENTFELNQLSDQTIHSASITQHTEFITIAVIIYSLNKLVGRRSHIPQALWNSFIRKFNDELSKSIEELKRNNPEEFGRHLDHAKELLVTLSPKQRQDVEEVLKKASINKAGKIFEHGISLTRTAHLLGITPWELTAYVGQGNSMENPYTKTIDIKKRIKIAEDFFG